MLILLHTHVYAESACIDGPDVNVLSTLPNKRVSKKVWETFRSKIQEWLGSDFSEQCFINFSKTYSSIRSRSGRSRHLLIYEDRNDEDDLFQFQVLIYNN